MTNQGWLQEQFEFEYCAECGGDAEHHAVVGVPGIGTPFAYCLFAPSAETEWEWHPAIQAFHAAKAVAHD